MNMSKRVKELREHDCNSCITMAECASFSFMQICLAHTRISAKYYCTVQFSCASCKCASIFSNTALCFQSNVSGFSQMVLNDLPTALQKGCACPYSAGRGHVLTSLSARVSALCSISVQLSCM